MKIGELAKRSGLTQSRIRFYERIGLLKAVDRRSNGYRVYPAEALVALEIIATAQAAGFSLDEIRVLMPGDLEQWDHDALMDTLRGKVAEIGRLQDRLARTKARLEGLIREIEARPDDIDCAANARRVLSHLFDHDTESEAARG
ncbi:MerR family transcriptional regulator [Sphingomonas sp. MMSM20]|uniref:MerR family transcriptional regulator n=1 Tax=Sphingomonas lycopersici TaxID=2951807 RepID=UPI002237251D|nr:MerR family transcriptional regulator [Sphingomonas lycopersici]MCW6532590.1 MerR family transcriptional regulator [Sphingomonas lycopersici]